MVMVSSIYKIVLIKCCGTVLGSLHRLFNLHNPIR